MRKSIYLLAFALFLPSLIHAQKNAYQLTNKSWIRFVNKSEASKIISTSDIYTQNLSEFDLQSKLQTTEKIPTEADYLKNAAKKTLNWSSFELNEMKKFVADIKKSIESNHLKFILPDTVKVLKTTCQEEGNAAGYTRQDFIVLNSFALSKTLLIHELFHIVSRYNPELRARIYRVFGFQICNEIKLPEDVQKLRISNPDAPHLRHFININYKGKEYPVAMIIYSDRKYKGGTFFNYLHVGLLVLEKNSETKKMQVALFDGEATILNFADVKNLTEQLGKNTDYTIHPEEISADHFVFYITEKQNLPNPEIFANYKAAFHKN